MSVVAIDCTLLVSQVNGLGTDACRFGGLGTSKTRPQKSSGVIGARECSRQRDHPRDCVFRKSSHTLASLATARCGKSRVISREKLTKEIAALERELQRARFEAQKNEAALSALDDQRREREERLTVAVRAQQDLEQQIEEKQTELERAEAAAALDTLNVALVDRDAAAEAFAAAAQSVMLRLQEFDAAQESAETVWQELVSGGALAFSVGGELPARDPSSRPEVFREALSRLVELVRERSDQEFERDLVEQAARSPAGNAIPTLPTHLQDLARARFFALAQERRRKQAYEA